MLYVVRSIYIGNWDRYKDDVVYGTVVTDEELARLCARRRRLQLNQHWRVEIVTLSEVVATEYNRSDCE